MRVRQKQNRGMFTSDFYCTKCGRKGIMLMRSPSSRREPGHLKNLYCPFCKEEVNHAEIRPFGKYTYEVFKQEYDLGRFVDGKREEVKNLPSCKHPECPCCVNGKCWNSNHSYHCDFRNKED